MAIKLLRKDLPNKSSALLIFLPYRMVQSERLIASLQAEFDKTFTKDKPVIADFHGYPDTLKQILSNYSDSARFKVHGFMEQGSTTTPFEMLSVNSASLSLST